MSYNYPLPDGTFISVPDSTPTSVAEQWARRDFPELYKEVNTKKPEEGFFANVKGGYRDLMANNALGIGALGNEQAARDAARAARSQNDNIKTTSWEDVKNAEGIGNTVSTAGAFARDSMASTLPYMGQTMLGARAGAALGSFAGPVGTAVGAGLGGVAANIPAMFGSNLERQDVESPNRPFDKTAAGTAAVAQAALDATSTLFLFGRMAGINKLAGEALPKLFKQPADEVERKLVAAAQQTLLKAAGKGAVAGAVMEMPTELAQQVLERSQAGLALTGPEANKEYEATLAGAAAVGGMAGPVHSVMERGDAQAKLAARDRAATEQARALAASQEEEKIKAEEARKKTPEYLTQLDAQYKERIATIARMQEAIKAFGKPTKESAEALLKKKAQDELSAYVKSTEALQKAFAEKKGEIEALNERQGMTQDEYWHFKNYGVKPDRYNEPAAGTTELGPDEFAAGQTPPAPKAADPAAQTQQVLAKALNGVRFQKEQTGEDLTAEDIHTALTQSPATITAARFAFANKIGIPGIDDATSVLLLKEIEKQAAKAEKADLANTMAQRQADLATQATNATQETDPIAAYDESKQSLDEEVGSESVHDKYVSLGLNEDNSAGPGYLDGIWEKATGSGNKVGERTVAIPEGVRPISNAKNILEHVDSLFSEVDAANKAMDVARASRNGDAANEAARQREKAETMLARLTEATPIAGGLIAARKAQETALNQAAWVLDDLNANRVLGAQNDDARHSASSTPETLRHQAEAARQEYIQAVIKEAAIVRTALGKSLPEKEAYRAIAEIQRVFNEWMTRAAALPRSAVEEERLVSPAQMRGTELVKSAEYEKVDPRPLRERKLGAYQAATEVLRDSIKRIVAGLMSTPRTGERVEPLLKTQFAESEAAKVAEAKGETAKTRSGELRRRRDYVSEQLERALGRGAIPPVQRAMQAAKDAIDAGEGTTDDVSAVDQAATGQPSNHFTAGLLDAAGELAHRVLNRQLERTYLDKLVGEIEAVTGKQIAYGVVKDEGNISRPRKGITLSSGERIFKQPVTTIRATAPVSGEDERQGNLFDPAPFEKKQRDTKVRIDKLVAQVAELKAGRHQSLKEGVSAAKRISGLEKAIAILQKDKQTGIDDDVRALRKENARLQGDLGYMRATATNFSKAPEVVAGRRAADNTAQIRKEWDAIDAKAKADREALQQRLDDIDARLSDFAWMPNARSGGTDLVVAGPYSKVAPITGLTLDEERVAKQKALQAGRSSVAKALQPQAGRMAPLTEAEEAEERLKRQKREIEALYADIIRKAFNAAKEAGFTPELGERMNRAADAIEAAKAWIGSLEEEWAKHQTETRAQTDKAALGQVLAHNTSLIKERKRVNAEMRKEIDEAKQRMDAAEKEIKAVQKEARESINAVEIVASAASDKSLVFQKRILQDYADLFTARGFVVDLDAGTVRTPAGATVAPLQARVVEQKQAVERAETNYAEEAARLRVQQDRLGLGGRRVSALTPKERTLVEQETARRERGIIEREDASTSIKEARERALQKEGIPGITQKAPSTADAAEMTAERQSDERVRHAAEAAQRKETNEEEKARLNAEIDGLKKQADAKRTDIQDAKGTKIVKARFEEDLKRILEEIAAKKLALDAIGKRRTYRQQPMMVKQSAAPVTMRTGSPESAAATLNARAAQGKLSERDQIARDNERALVLVGTENRTDAQEKELQGIRQRRINREAVAIKGTKAKKEDKVAAFDEPEANLRKGLSRSQNAIDEDSSLFRKGADEDLNGVTIEQTLEVEGKKVTRRRDAGKTLAQLDERKSKIEALIQCLQGGA